MDNLEKDALMSTLLSVETERDELKEKLERSEKEKLRYITQYIEAAKYNKYMFDENIKIGEENKNLQRVVECAQIIDWEWILSKINDIEEDYRIKKLQQAIADVEEK